MQHAGFHFRVAAEVQKAKKVKLSCQVGTTIEVPRGALTDEIAQTAECRRHGAAIPADPTAQFSSFGTNALTQTAPGVCRLFLKVRWGGYLASRDDMGNFLNAYTENEVFKKNPFASLDQVGVGQLVKIAIEKGRATRPDIKLGI